MTWKRGNKPKEWMTAAFLLAMAITNVASVVRLAPYLREGYQDFTIFYAAARMVRGGQAQALYDLPSQFREQQGFAPNVSIRQDALPYNHPPFEALLFIPLTFLPYFPAYLVWTVFNVIFVVAALLLLRSIVLSASLRQSAIQVVQDERQDVPPVTDSDQKAPSVCFLMLAAVAFVPVTRALLQGQDSLLLLLLLTVALWSMEKGSDSAAGVALAMGLFKFQLVLPLVLLLALRRSRVLLGFAPVAALLALISVIMVGWSGVVDYVQFLLRLENTGAGGAIVATVMPNLRGMIVTVAPDLSGVSLMLLTVVASTVVLVVAWWAMRTMKDCSGFTFGLATVAAILVSYHALTYDLSLLLPVALLLYALPGSEENGQRKADIILLVLFYLAFFIEPNWPHVNQFAWPFLILGWMLHKSGRVLGSQSSVQA
jgi:hypothetical protein